MKRKIVTLLIILAGVGVNTAFACGCGCNHNHERSIQSEENTEEKVPEDVYNILKVEMWSEKRTSRGFPAPQNKTLLFNHLDNAFSRLKEAKFNLEEYHMRSANNSGD